MKVTAHGVLGNLRELAGCPMQAQPERNRTGWLEWDGRTRPSPTPAFSFFFGQNCVIVLTAIENPDYVDPIFAYMEGDGNALSIAGDT